LYTRIWGSSIQLISFLRLLFHSFFCGTGMPPNGVRVLKVLLLAFALSESDKLFYFLQGWQLWD
jgi:hypothetical protein